LESRIELWVKLKVADLVVETAWFTLTEKLDFTGTIYGLSRYSCWFMDISGPDVESILDELDGMVKLDSAFINQNKHRYSLIAERTGAGEGVLRRGDFRHESDFVFRESTPEGGMLREAPQFDLYACDCLITAEENSGDYYLDRLSGRTGNISIEDVKSGQVWRLILKAGGRDRAADLVEKIAVTRSRREGLLLNPHFQEHRIIRIEKVSGTGSIK